VLAEEAIEVPGGLAVLPGAAGAEDEGPREGVESLVVGGRVGVSANDVLEDPHGGRGISRLELGVGLPDEPVGLEGRREP
jgi:hypothetical protein